MGDGRAESATSKSRNWESILLRNRIAMEDRGAGFKFNREVSQRQSRNWESRKQKSAFSAVKNFGFVLFVRFCGKSFVGHPQISTGLELALGFRISGLVSVCTEHTLDARLGHKLALPTAP